MRPKSKRTRGKPSPASHRKGTPVAEHINEVASLLIVYRSLSEEPMVIAI